MNQKANAFEATLLVAGNIMGSGIFLVPTQLAGQGSVALLGWIVSLVGVAALALTFAQLSAFDESSSTMGGMYGFTRKPFGRRVGWFVTATYFMSVVFGNCAGAIVGVGYLSLLWPLDSRSLVIVTVVAIWAVTVLNLVGAHAVVRVQGVCTVLTCLPIFAVAVFGWISFDAAVFWESWNVSGESDFWAVQRGLNVQLWAFTGLFDEQSICLLVQNSPSNKGWRRRRPCRWWCAIRGATFRLRRVAAC
jgi:arginine:agmatine antiporter